jgi:prepilin-type processing-associated H-X9-DG protein
MQTSWEPIVDCDTGAVVYPGLPFTGAATHFLNPQMSSIYPEYLPDPSIAICPSSPKLTEDSLFNPATRQSEAQLMCFAPIPGPPFGQYDRERGLALMDESYWYAGYVFDRVDPEDPTAPISELTSDSTLDGPAQLVYGMALAIGGFFGGSIDENLDLSDYDDNLGNAGTDTVYRLREGVERFLITDINNAGASAQAQSTVWIMSDRLSSFTIDFNHIPGGANVLFLDGHVDFVKLNERAPVLPAVAVTFGEISIHGS